MLISEMRNKLFEYHVECTRGIIEIANDLPVQTMRSQVVHQTSNLRVGRVVVGISIVVQIKGQD